ncbi:restriction endonuclease [Gloeocapsa sp. PCC 73106]|uniref:restriction endonuclease n=1 Tax=Gloeocapsa sp. PCC 73106 TaxID=102232 RepID=UPI0002ABCE8D|nr:restriction endonuclease [Gloeocapsa sp. PCC 73106]ELR97605.1 restriction endonuclease [Gloeocapsa sp. PCC 73106]
MSKNSKLVPSHDYFFGPIIKALKQLGGSANVQEIYDLVCDIENISEAQQAILHKEGPQTEIKYRMSWARTDLKIYGAIDNIGRGVWALTSQGRELKSIDKNQIKRYVNNERIDKDEEKEKIDTSLESIDDQGFFANSEDWIPQLLTLLQQIPPDSFERLCQRILRESGFIKVEVTGKRGDGGIDGIGVLKIALLSFQVFFQCKRYSGSVGASEIRDFRGAMIGRTDKGLLITTGTFTSSAKQEATRDGAPVLDLIDGEQLCRILKDLKMGVETKTIEVVEIKKTWFEEI